MAALLPVTMVTLVGLAFWQDHGVVKTARQHRIGHEPAILRELAELCAIPNVAFDRASIRKNAHHLQGRLQARDIEARLLESRGANPAVYGEWPGKDAEHTVIFYCHYDGQPVDPRAWKSDPWKPRLLKGKFEDRAEEVALDALPDRIPDEWRLYARSASDDKAPIIALFAVIDALKGAGISPSINVKFLFEGEEEAGSSNLPDILKAHRELLEADAWILCDGPVHQTGRPQIAFGARGVIGVGITLFGPNQALHSGHYGNWAPNPAAELCRLIASMRGAQGEILIEGFADVVRAPTKAELAAIAASPGVDELLLGQYDLGRSEGNGRRVEECLLAPALNVKGISSGAVGNASRNAIPSQATASLGFRLVPDLSPDRVRPLVEAHLRSQGYFLTDQPPTPEILQQNPRVAQVTWTRGYPSYRAPMDHPFCRALSQVMTRLTGGDLVQLPTMGGSVPMDMFHRIFEVPLVILPIVNHDNHQHAPNENIRLGNLWTGIEIYAEVIATLGEAWTGPK